MKKRLNIAMIALVLLSAGCTKTDVATPKTKAVAFQVGSYAPQTKAPEGTASVIATDVITSFSSRGYLHAVGVDSEQHFFGAAGETITYNGTNAWLPSHDYFWPKSTGSYVNFISWKGGEPAITYAKDGEVWTAGFAWNNVTVNPTDNLLFADVAWRYNANAQTYLFDGVTEGVPTLFHHALAQVRFMGRLSTVSADEGKVNWAATVTGFSLAGVKNQGSLSLTNADPGSTQTQAWSGASWTAGEGTTAITPATTPIAIALDGTAQQIIGWQSVLPQAVTTDMGLTVNYTVTTTYKNSSNETVKTVAEDVTARAALPDFSGSIAAWEMNKRYTYTIVINPDTGIINIIPVETNWIEESEYPINIE